MIEFDTRIPLNEETVKAQNLTDRLTDVDLMKISTLVWDGYIRDKKSRDKWEKRTQAAMDLAMQLQKDKNFPWPGCSNVAFPLVTIAAMQFHSRAYPAVVQGRELVLCKVNGQDPDGKLGAQAQRIGMHMSYQLLEESQTWEEQHDRMLLNIPIVGCAFKKSYYSGLLGQNVSELVLAQDLVLDYFAKGVEACARKTHMIPMYRNEIYEGIMSGIYRDVREEAWYQGAAVPLTDRSTWRKDERTGQTAPQTDEDTPYTLLEQHVNIDLDGDGYKEPYIATIEATSKCLLRLVTRIDNVKNIVRNYKGEILKIHPVEYFTKYGFIPSPDGGVYDIGFGVLLGPLNESVNSILNQLIDAGTMSNSAGGFLGRGAKIRGGVYTFAPLEWKRVDSTGDDLKKSIFPLPVREPSNVLFQLLNLLIGYTNKVSGATDTMMGESTGQNTPAQTTQTMVEQGMKIYNNIFKRVWRSMKEEFKKLYLINGLYLPEVTAFGADGMKILREDYLGEAARISPVADPNVTSDAQRKQQAQMVKQAAAQTPGYDTDAVERNFLRAMHVDGYEALFPGKEKLPPPPNIKLQVEQLKLEYKKTELDMKKQMFMADMIEAHAMNQAKIIELEAHAMKLAAEATGVETGHQIAAFQTAVGALKVHDEALRGRVELMMKSMEAEKNGQQTTNGAGMGGVAGASGNQGAAQNGAA